MQSSQKKCVPAGRRPPFKTGQWGKCAKGSLSLMMIESNVDAVRWCKQGRALTWQSSDWRVEFDALFADRAGLASIGCRHLDHWNACHYGLGSLKKSATRSLSVAKIY